MKKLFISEKGWIFIDSILGMVILVVAILALADTYIMSAKSNTYAKNYGQALALAQKYVEDHKNINNTPIDTNRDLPQKTFGMYTITPFSKIQTSESLGDLIIPVQIIVSWHEQSGDKQVSIVNYYYIK